MTRRVSLLLVLALTFAGAPARGQTAASPGAAGLGDSTRVESDITYLTVSHWDAKLDVYVPRSPGPHPTLLTIHGGGWRGGSREGEFLRAVPFLEMGMAVVNVSYRLTPVAEAPAAVEDCRCALRWVIRNAKQYGFDVTRVAVTGYSAGGHLALMTGMLPASAGFDGQCPGTEELKVAAVVNWYGITDVADLLEGTNMRTFAVEWLGRRPDRLEAARRLSPLTWVRKDLPPILTIHGDADPTVPYAQATKLHDALQQAGATSELVTIPNGGHSRFPLADQQRAVEAVRVFLTKHGILRPALAMP
jgi:acetyl esterase/lipase